MLPIDLNGTLVSFEARAFLGPTEDEEALVLIHQQVPIAPDSEPLVYIHSGCLVGDAFHSVRCDCRRRLGSALTEIANVDFGILVYLVTRTRLLARPRLLQCTTVVGTLDDQREANDCRLAAFILKGLGIKSIRLTGMKPLNCDAFRLLGFSFSCDLTSTNAGPDRN